MKRQELEKISDEENEKIIFVRNKFKLSLLKTTERAFDGRQRVDQSLSEVPVQFIEMHQIVPPREENVRINDTYFSMPLYQTLNPEIINFDSPDLDKKYLDFLCYRYTDQQPEVEYDSKSKESQGAWLYHLQKIREEHDNQLFKLLADFVGQIRRDIEKDDDSEPGLISTMSVFVGLLR